MSETDAVLWARAVAGETECFGVLFERHAKRIHQHCWRRTADAALAEDLVSVTFLEAWRRREAVVLSQDSALPWLLGVANNVCRNASRALRRYGEALRHIPAAGVVDDVGEAAVERIDAKRQMEKVLSKLESLSSADQDVIALCVWQELSYEEASIALGIPIGTVQSRLSRARARLRDVETSNDGEQTPPRGHRDGEQQMMLRRLEDQ